jgi:hypothetical protein
MLTEKDQKFLAARRKAVRLGRPVFVVLLFLFLGVYGYLWFRVPLLANPFHVLGAIEQNALADTTLQTLAVLCPLCFLMAWFLVVLAVVLLLSLLQTERRYLGIVERASEGVNETTSE